MIVVFDASTLISSALKASRKNATCHELNGGINSAIVFIACKNQPFGSIFSGDRWIVAHVGNAGARVLPGVEMSLRAKLLLLGILLARSHQTLAQLPIPVPDIKQIGAMWCWAAVSEQLIRWKNGGPGPNQCEMVSMSMGLPAVACCSPPNPTVLNQCNTKGGSLQDIQAGMAAFGHTYSAITPPGSPQQLSDELVQGHPVIVEIRSTPVSNHVMVITGIFNTPNGPMVQINDPADPASAPVRGTY